MASLPCVFSSVCVCVLVSSSDKGTHHIRLGFTLMNSLYLNCLFKGPISKHSHIPKYWGLRLQHMKDGSLRKGGGVSNHRQTNQKTPEYMQVWTMAEFHIFPQLLFFLRMCKELHFTCTNTNYCYCGSFHGPSEKKSGEILLQSMFLTLRFCQITNGSCPLKFTGLQNVWSRHYISFTSTFPP